MNGLILLIAAIALFQWARIPPPKVDSAALIKIAIASVSGVGLFIYVLAIALTSGWS
jgi:hypothetical protein